jgi:hypothetical protein
MKLHEQGHTTMWNIPLQSFIVVGASLPEAGSWYEPSSKWLIKTPIRDVSLCRSFVLAISIAAGCFELQGHAVMIIMLQRLIHADLSHYATEDVRR